MKTPIPNKLKEYRKKSRLTQTEVAQRLGFCSAERISFWEQGKRLPSITNLFRLSKIYNTLPNDLYPDFTNDINK